MMLMRYPLVLATTLTAAIFAGCGPNTVTVTERGCTPMFSNYDSVWGKRTVGYDRNSDGIVDEAIQAALPSSENLTATRLSSLPLNLWSHYGDTAVAAPMCWSTSRMKNMTPDDVSRFMQLLQTEY